jgi:crotonobetainyl-CoA:carnitine CoA-transferase CaiB-like acyl-CoA transferase
VVGAPGALAEIPGHDLTYQAEVDLVPGMQLPASLFADMGGAMMASEAVLKATLTQRASGKGCFHEVALSDAAAWLALPRHWGMTLPNGAVGGAHAGYKIYACKNGRVAVAALEPHFAKSLCDAAGIEVKDVQSLFAKSTHDAVAAFLASKTRHQLDKLATDKDIPMLTLPKAL